MSSHSKFDVDLVEKFLETDECRHLFQRIIADKSHFKHAALTVKGAPSKKRNKTIYGDGGHYVYIYKGKSVTTPIRPWSRFPELCDLRDRIAEISGQTYKTCVIQIYNSGCVEIKPHRDKEMLSGKVIASVSLGVERVMRFERKGWETEDLLLEEGMLCLINPPTNDYWLHSIPPDNSTGRRISLVFR